MSPPDEKFHDGKNQLNKCSHVALGEETRKNAKTVKHRHPCVMLSGSDHVIYYPTIRSHALETLQAEAHLHVLFLFSARNAFSPASSLIRPFLDKALSGGLLIG